MVSTRKKELTMRLWSGRASGAYGCASGCAHTRVLQGLQEPITIYHIGDRWWDLCAGQQHRVVCVEVILLLLLLCVPLCGYALAMR